MKILLDECMGRRLTKEFVDHNIKAVPQMGWAGIKDAELLVLAAVEFNIFITAVRGASALPNRNLSFQQNLTQFDIAVIVLQSPSNRLADLKPLVPKIIVILGEAIKGKAILVGIE